MPLVWPRWYAGVVPDQTNIALLFGLGLEACREVQLFSPPSYEEACESTPSPQDST
jgi:hypothetical protein